VIAKAKEEAARRHQEAARQKEQENKEAERRHREEIAQKKQEMEMAQKMHQEEIEKTEKTSRGDGSKGARNEGFNKKFEESMKISEEDKKDLRKQSQEDKRS
jgi:hypothetical protein